MTITKETLTELAWDLAELIDSASPEEQGTPLLEWVRRTEHEARQFLTQMERNSSTRPASPSEHAPVLSGPALAAPKLPTF